MGGGGGYDWDWGEDGGPTPPFPKFLQKVILSQRRIENEMGTIGSA
jgi:hypothetical protein